MIVWAPVSYSALVSTKRVMTCGHKTESRCIVVDFRYEIMFDMLVFKGTWTRFKIKNFIFIFIKWLTDAF